MSYRTFTFDQFMQLSPPALKVALRLFNQELDGTIKFLGEDPEARRDAGTLDDLSHLLTLRKAFQGRLDELEAEDVLPALASQQFALNELEPALV